MISFNGSWDNPYSDGMQVSLAARARVSAIRSALSEILRHAQLHAHRFPGFSRPYWSVRVCSSSRRPVKKGVVVILL